MQVTNLYDAWEVRTPFNDEVTYREARDNLMKSAKEMGIHVVHRRSKGQRFYGQPRFHFWEINNEVDAMAFYLAYGDQIKTQKYPVSKKFN